jgi:hypothetical protein
LPFEISLFGTIAAALSKRCRSVEPESIPLTTTTVAFCDGRDPIWQTPRIP